ncbi:hypothetical protein HYH02_012060 [Chlamydomonas schloesseri]|uniref:Flagellar associated protein n=1 Tax=Chlamydomonas schloesseri TaxID=2026947 RepID=A0A835T361_9CHLO|nr:hypothetical protein HYH02_012060 [Chlamydomonas schloesseri]|eukprot:KAG2435063.1 hypothetical protein HYH02_012060 [Chlamydomonas schloesseri]
MSQQIMTNMGPRRKGSARLEPLAYGGSSGGRASPSTSDLTGEMPVVPDGRSPGAHLPPLNRVRDTAGETFDSVLADDASPGASPARRARKAALMTRGDVDHRSVLQASLALDQKEREMALIRDNKREYGRILLELWVNQVLDSQSTANNPLGGSGGGGLGDPLKMDASALKGLASYGLTRVELLGAGLSNEGIDRLYRCMYVYTVGFFDVMQDILSHNDFKTEILSNVWKGFLTIAESALQVSFRSDYLKLYQSQQVAMAELLFAKEQLSEARQDSVNTEKAVAWLTNAHAEERAARQALKSQLQELQGVLERERQAHTAAVTKYVAEVEERVRLQAQLGEATAQLSAAAVAQVDLIVQRDTLTEQLAAAEARAGALAEHVREVYEALAMDTALRPNKGMSDQLEELLAAARQAEEAAAAAEAAARAAAAAAAAAEGAAASDAASDAEHDAGSHPGSRPPSHRSGVGRISSEGLAPPEAAAAAAGTAASGGAAATAAAGQPPPRAPLPRLEPGARAEATLLYADLVGDLTRQLYQKWRDQTDLAAANARQLYEARDVVRSVKLQEHELQTELDRTRTTAAALQRSLKRSEEDAAAAHAEVSRLQAELEALMELKTEADRQITQLTDSLATTTDNLQRTQVERNTLADASGLLQSDLDSRDSTIAALRARLATEGETLAEISRSMVVFAKAAAAQDIARGFYKQRFQEASKRAGDLQWSIFRAERQIRTLEAKIEHKNGEVSTLAAATEQAKAAAELAQQTLAGALLDIENKKALIASLERALISAQEEGSRLRQDLVDTVQRAEEAERELEEAREEIQRQVEAMEALEGRIAAASEERGRLLKQIERLVGEKAEVEKMAKQQRETMQTEISKRGSEIASLRSEVESVNLKMEALKSDMGQAGELLERKREKKKKWKATSALAAQEVAALKAALDERDGCVAELTARLEPIELDVALLMADRGRDAAAVQAPEEEGEGEEAGDDTAAAGRGDQTPGDMSAVQRQWDDLSRAALELQSKLEAQQRAVEAARREYETARASFYEAPTEEGRKNLLLGIEAVLAKLRVERKDTEMELAALRERQADLRGALQAHENAAFKRRLAVVARRTGKTEFTLQHELSRRLDESKERESKLAGTLESQSLAAITAQSRAAKLESDFVRTEAEMRELADKLKKTLEFKVELERQLAQYKNMVGFLQSEVSSLSRERDALKANLQDVDQRIERLTSDVVEAQSAVGTTARRLEAKYEAEKREAVAAAVEKQRHLEALLAQSHARIKELEGLTGSATASLRRYLAASLDRLERSLPPRFIWHISRPDDVREAIVACGGELAQGDDPDGSPRLGTPAGGGGGGGASGPSSPGPSGLQTPGTGQQQQQQQVVVAGAAAAVSGLPSLVHAMEGVPFSTNFDFQADTVLRWMAGSWSFDVTLVTISQLYVEKLQADIHAEEGLLGGVAGPRQPLEAAMYDFFTNRYGCRQATELHLAAFLGAVRRFRSQHPKVRTFARLLGLPEPPPPPGAADDPLTRGPLPPAALEFYLTLVNRVHARAGPLIAEAAEGFSLVKAKVLTRLAREFLRGSFATTRDDVAATPDYVRHMALNDEEKSIDLELALEAILRAFVAQYREDFDALCAIFRANFENMGRKLVTPDDLAMFLRTLNAEKAGALSPGRILGLYVEAARAAGPTSAELGKHLCRVVLESGFVGIATHVSRHEPIRALPPYDEFELLEESWRLMRVAVEQQVAVSRSHPEKVKADLPSYVDLARRVDELVGGREAAAPAWVTYRRLLTTYASLRPVVEEIMPFDPPSGDFGRAKKTAAAAAADGASRQGGPQGEGDEWEESGSPSRDVSPMGRRSMRSTVGHKSMGAALSRSASNRSLGGDGAASTLYDLSGANAAAAAAAQRKGGKLLAPKSGAPTEPNSPMPLGLRKPVGIGGGDDGAHELLNASVVKLKFDATGGR